MLEFNATFIVAIVSFAVFIVIMNAIFYRPIFGVIKKREDYLNSNYSEAEKNEKEADSQKNNYTDTLTMTQQKCLQHYIKAKTDAYDMAMQDIKGARLEAKHKIAEEKQSLRSQENQLQRELESTCINDIAISIQSKIIGN